MIILDYEKIMFVIIIVNNEGLAFENNTTKAIINFATSKYLKD